MEEKKSKIILIVSLISLVISIGSFCYAKLLRDINEEKYPKLFLALGDEGRLDISDLGIHIPLYHATEEKSAQDVIDDLYSGCYSRSPGVELVSDHRSSGSMCRLEEADSGTIAELTPAEGDKRQYRCFYVEPGYVIGRRLHTPDGVIVRTNPYGADLVVYTCQANQPWDDRVLVIVTYWKSADL